MTVSTRHATIEDTPEIMALWKRFMAEENEAVPDADPEEAEGPWTARLRKLVADSKVIVAISGDVIVGFFAFIDAQDRPWVPAGTAYAVDIYVAPEARRAAATKRLLDAAADLLRARYAETWTNTHIENRRMRRLLERAGFEPLLGFEIQGLRDQAYYRVDNQAIRRDAGKSLR
jgi:ribosomal protein S18 acetylase RimI-like enzyme